LNRYFEISTSTLAPSAEAGGLAERDI
jgi:hypothetical protein